MARCTDKCKRPTPSQCHCAACHHTFGGISNFDAHRRNGHCLTPPEIGCELREGVWRTPMTDSAREKIQQIHTKAEEGS